MAHDAPQCGFCTSGQLMSARALLARDPHPTAEEVQAALTGNLCRCSNYNRYVAATVAAGAGRKDRSLQSVSRREASGRPPLAKLKTIGEPTTRIDARQRVS